MWMGCMADSREDMIRFMDVGAWQEGDEEGAGRSIWCKSNIVPVPLLHGCCCPTPHCCN